VSAIPKYEVFPRCSLLPTTQTYRGPQTAVRTVAGRYDPHDTRSYAQLLTYWQ